MQFLLKLFKALNSAQTPWQVTFAITIGMVAGLTPLSGIQTVVIFFLAFLLNIHLGLFFASSAFFAVLWRNVILASSMALKCTFP